MPMVPETFAPSVSQGETPMTPASGPWVSPMRNAAPGLLQQTGATLMEAGNTAARLGNTIGDRVQETLDDGLTKAAETQFLKGAQDVLSNPQSGYLFTRGLTAQQQFDPAAQAIAKARQDARATLTNPIQQRMYDQVTNDHLLTLGRTMADHQHEQVTQFGIQQGQDRADSMNLLARSAYLQGRMDDFQKYSDQARDEVLHVASLSGAAPDSDVAQAMLRAKHTDLVHGITIGLLDDHKYDQAKQFFEAEQPNIDMRASELLGNAVKTEYDRNLTETKGDAYLAAAASAHTDAYMAVSNPKGLVERGNLPIWNRPTIQNDDGTHSSEYSVSFQDDKGREVLVPTVVNGRFLTPDGKKPEEGSAAEKAMFQAAWDHYLKTGENLGKFDNPDDADAYSQVLHNRGEVPAKNASVPYTYGPLATGSTINPLRITDVPGSPRANGRVHDGYDIAMPAGTAVTAPLDGKVVKVWNDEQYGGGLSMRVQLADGNTLGIAHLSAANLKEGDTVNRGQVLALSGRSGNATGNVLHVALEDPDGKHIDYFGASKAQPDQGTYADPNVLSRAIEMAKGDSSLDPFQQKQVINYMYAQHKQQWAAQEQEYQQVKQQAIDTLIGNGFNFSALPAAVKSQLRPSDILELQTRMRGITEQEQKQAEIPILANWAEHPEEQTEAAVSEAYAKGQLAPDTYVTALREARRLQTDPSYLRQATVDHDQLTDTLAMNQLTNLAFPKTNDDRTQRVEIETAIKNEILLQEQNAKRPLTWQEKGKIARDIVTDKVYTPGFFTAGSPKPVALLKPDELEKATVWVGGQKVRMMDIPAKYALEATQELASRNVPTTQANVAAWWIRKGKPTQ